MWTGSPSAQELSAFGDTALYEKVIQRLFQADAPGSTTEELLRYTYSESGEMQVRIRRAPRGPLELELWRLPEGAPTVWRQLETLWRSVPTITAEDAASRIAIQRVSKTIPGSGHLPKILSARPASVGLDGLDVIFLHGSRYELTISSLSRTVMLSLQGPQDWRRSEDQIIRWMGRVQVAVRELELAP